MYLTYIQHVGCPSRLLIMATTNHNYSCPDCNVPFMQNETWTDSPLPCPFVEQSTAKCALIIKPSVGFFESYNIGDDLHIGISDSQSVVHSYWTDGMTSQDSTWNMSILVYDLLPFFSNNSQWFDHTVFAFMNQFHERFQSSAYNEYEWNCFDFVIEFLKYCNFGHYEKVNFVSQFLQTTLRMSNKYCQLVKKVQEKGYLHIS